LGLVSPAEVCLFASNDDEFPVIAEAPATFLAVFKLSERLVPSTAGFEITCLVPALLRLSLTILALSPLPPEVWPLVAGFDTTPPINNGRFLSE
jgi:hypothetical protein